MLIQTAVLSIWVSGTADVRDMQVICTVRANSLMEISANVSLEANQHVAVQGVENKKSKEYHRPSANVTGGRSHNAGATCGR